jgi:hypothetical protein
MQFIELMFCRPPTMPERCYPVGIIVESMLCVWAISRWRGLVDLACRWLNSGYAHLPSVTPLVFHLDIIYDPSGTILVAILAHFTNPYYTYSLIGQIFWCRCCRW